MNFIENKERLTPLLADLKKEGVKNFIGGEWQAAASKATFENQTPIDNSVICDVAQGEERDIEMAAEAAKKAFEDWRSWPHKKRRDILYRIAEEIEKHAEDIAILESYDTGQCIRFMKKSAIRGAANFRYFADQIIDAGHGDSMPDEHHINYSIRQPIGPVGVITPWNVPFMLSTWKIAPALAAGCTIVHKPAELSPVTAQLLARLADRAGLPKGVWNTVNGYGETAGKALTEHEAIKAVAFVGETTTGSHIMRQGAATLKRVHFELGGKNPVIVFDDADLERALDAVVFMKYSLNGERCTSSSRLILHESIYNDFMEKLKTRVGNLKVGHPLDPNTEVGPMIHSSHQEKVLSYAALAREEGAIILQGGEIPEGMSEGAYVMPTLVEGVTPDMRLGQEEVFGPFLSVLSFKTEQEAISLANSTRYGLTAYIWTKDVGRSIRMARDVEAGMIWVNSQNVRHLPTPFGGVKYSGIGRDGGDYSFDFYMETKNISIAYDTHTIPQLGV